MKNIQWICMLAFASFIVCPPNTEAASFTQKEQKDDKKKKKKQQPAAQKSANNGQKTDFQMAMEAMGQQQTNCNGGKPMKKKKK